MIRIIDCIDKRTGSRFSVKVFHDKRFSDLSILIPMEYEIYTKKIGCDEFIWRSRDELSYELISSIGVDAIQLVNRNICPIYMYLMRYEDKKGNLEYLKFAAANCQSFTLWKDDQHHLSNATYELVNDCIMPSRGIYINDYIDLIEPDAYNGFNMGYEEL